MSTQKLSVAMPTIPAQFGKGSPLAEKSAAMGISYIQIACDFLRILCSNLGCHSFFPQVLCVKENKFFRVVLMHSS